MLPDVIQTLNSLGYRCPLQSGWYGKVDEWEKWYTGRTDFHTYKTYNGTRFVTCQKKTLRMAKTLSEDRADILLNEHTDIVVEQARAQKFIDDLFDKEKFWERANQLIEKVGWSGTGAFVQYKQGENIHIDYADAKSIYPLMWSGDNVTACAFASTYIGNDGKPLLSIVVHAPNPVTGLYYVRNHLVDESGREVGLPNNIHAMWDSGSKYPTFQIVRLAMQNNFERNNPMGIAIFANAIDILKSLDDAYDSMANEFMLGRKRIFVDSSIVNVDTTTGEIIPLFDVSDVVFYGIPGMSGDDGKGLPIKEIDMTLRVTEHVSAIQNNLDLLSLKTGFGRGFYRFEAMQVTTATEVISTDAKMYRRIRKDEIALTSALQALTKTLLFLGGFSAEQEISVKFDDSVIEDSNAIAQRSLQEYQAGVISLEQYYERVDKLREKAASARAKRTREERAADTPKSTEPSPTKVDPNDPQAKPKQGFGAGDGGAYRNTPRAGD